MHICQCLLAAQFTEWGMFARVGGVLGPGWAVRALWWFTGHLIDTESREETAHVCFNLTQSFSDARSRSVFDEAAASLKLACGNLLRFLSEAWAHNLLFILLYNLLNFCQLQTHSSRDVFVLTGTDLLSQHAAVPCLFSRDVLVPREFSLYFYL